LATRAITTTDLFRHLAVLVLDGVLVGMHDLTSHFLQTRIPRNPPQTEILPFHLQLLIFLLIMDNTGIVFTIYYFFQLHIKTMQSRE
jgi:hypothetical protein